MKRAASACSDGQESISDAKRNRLDAAAPHEVKLTVNVGAPGAPPAAAAPGAPPNTPSFAGSLACWAAESCGNSDRLDISLAALLGETLSQAIEASRRPAVDDETDDTATSSGASGGSVSGGDGGRRGARARAARDAWAAVGAGLGRCDERDEGDSHSVRPLMEAFSFNVLAPGAAACDVAPFWAAAPRVRA